MFLITEMNVYLCYKRHCLDIRDYLAAAVIYETVSDWPQVNISVTSQTPNDIFNM